MPQYQGVWTLQQQMQALTSGQWATDPNFKNTTLLLQGDGGANGAQNNTFYDTSPNQFAITRNGNTTQGTFSPFSATGWGSYNASSSTVNVGIYLNNQTDFAFGTGDFTIEMFVNLRDSGSTQVIYDSRPSSTQGLYPTIYLDNTTLKLKFFTNSADRITQTSTFTYNVWHHVVVTRTGTSTKMFIDGVQEGSTYTDSNNYIVGTDRPFTGEGYNTSGNSGVLGYMSNLRVVKGSGPYQNAGSSITVPTSQLTAVTNTVLLTLQSNRFVDNNTQTTAKTINTFNSPSIQPFSPFAPQYQWTSDVIGGSGYFDGTGDYLSGSGNPNLDFGTGAFTVELWVYHLQLKDYSGFIGGTPGATSGSQINIYTYADGHAGVTFDGVGEDASTAAGVFKLYQWQHVALVRSGNTFTLYVDGVSKATGSTTNASSLYANTGWSIGSTAGTGALNGYISGVRVTKGGSLYTTTFTPPTSPPTTTVSSGTVQLLCNFTNAGIYDGTMKNNLETVGNAQISTSVVKYGSGSMYFDGSGDYLSIPASKFWYIGTGDYTIEAWIYPTAWGDILSCFNTSSPYSGWNLQTGGATGGSPNGVMNMFISNGTTFVDYNATTVMSLNRWTHIAVVKSGTTLYQFINGVLDKTSTGILTPADSNNVLLVGISNLLARPYTGYIDDLRITKGVARYMQSFIPPSVALPRQ